MSSRMAGWLLVRPGEVKTVAYFFGLFLLLGVGMAIGQGSAEALFFKRYGIQHLPAMDIALSAVLCSTSVLYAAYADRVPAERLFELVFPVLVTAIGIAWALMQFSSASAAYPIYYLIYQVASELVVVHAVLYISQNLEILQIKRLSSLIMAGTQVGVIMGGLSLPLIVHAIGVQDVLLVWALALSTSLILMRLWHAHSGASKLFRRHRDHGKGQITRSVTHVAQGLRFLRESPLLRADSMALFFMVIAYYILGYSVNRIYAHTFSSDAALASFFGTLTAGTSAIALVLQTLLSNRVIARFGAKNINLIFPLTSLLSYGALLFSFAFWPALLGSVNNDALMPAFREPARHIIREALPGNMKGRAGALSLVVVLPAALLVCGAILLVTQSFNAPICYLLAGTAAAALYVRYSVQMNRTYASELVRHLKKTLSIPGGLLDKDLHRPDSKVLSELRSGVLHEDSQVAVAFAKAFLSAHPALAGAAVLERAAGAGPALQDQLLRLLIPHDIKGLEDYLLEHFATGDAHLSATMLSMLIRIRSAAALPLVEKALESASPRLASAGIIGALSLLSG